MNDLYFKPSGTGYEVRLNDELTYLVFRGDDLDDHDWYAVDIDFNVVDEDDFRYKLFDRLRSRDIV